MDTLLTAGGMKSLARQLFVKLKSNPAEPVAPRMEISFCYILVFIALLFSFVAMIRYLL